MGGKRPDGTYEAVTRYDGMRTARHGATFEQGMNAIREFNAGRRDMLDAFVELSTLARRAGVDADEITLIHGQFFDGNVAVKHAFRVAVLSTEARGLADVVSQDA